MGVGFNLSMVFIILPMSIILIIVWLVTKKNIFGLILLVIWGSIIMLVTADFIISPFFEKKVLEKNDFYGEYVVDRNFFKGKQADWQYNHFRFKITESDSIFFYQTEKKKIIKTYKGTISTLPQYVSKRLVINMENPTHHIVSSNPTIYREIWDFYIVFNSPRFYNMFFRKGRWKEIK